MAETITLRLSNGAVIGAEVSPTLAGLEGAPTIDFARVREALEGIGEELSGALKKISPSKGTVTFGLEIGGEAGVPLVTKGKATASIEVVLEWSDLANPSG